MSLHDDLDELADICEHMKPVGQWPGAKAIRALREAAELVRRVEDAQIREVEEEMHGLVIRAYPLKKGQRVRIVPEQGEGEGQA